MIGPLIDDITAATRRAIVTGTELPDGTRVRHASTSTGSIRSSAAAMYAISTAGSLSPGSRDTEATGRAARATHWASSVDLP